MLNLTEEYSEGPSAPWTRARNWRITDTMDKPYMPFEISRAPRNKNVKLLPSRNLYINSTSIRTGLNVIFLILSNYWFLDPPY